MWRDPFTLNIAVGKDGSATGTLYVDDGDSYNYRKGEYIWRRFSLKRTGSASTLTSVSEERLNHVHEMEVFPRTQDVVLYDNSVWSAGIKHVRIDRIVILGLEKQPKKVTYKGEALEWEWFDGEGHGSVKEGGVANKIVIKDPKALISEDWKIEIA